MELNGNLVNLRVCNASANLVGSYHVMDVAPLQAKNYVKS